jgi:MauM/NapG family ferredoxin protein
MPNLPNHSEIETPKKNEGRKAPAFRWGVRAFFLGACLLLVLKPNFAVGWLGSGPAGMSPLLALGKLRGGQISFLALLGIVLGFVALWRWRPFCRWICPLGTCNEVAAKLGGWCRLPTLRLWWLGQVLAVSALLGLILGIPLLLWLDPLAIWSSPWEAAGGGTSRLGMMGFAVGLVLLFSLATRGGWCRYLCLVGGLQEVLFFGRRSCVQRLRHWGSLSSRRNPPTPALPEIKDALQGNVMVDPSMLRNDSVAMDKRFIRRFFLGASLAGVAVVVPGPRPSREPRRLRPPGAQRPESTFLGLCVRCGNCLRACPAGILVADWSPAEWTGFAAPVVRFHDEYCHRDCVRCGQVCPTGAIQELQPSVKLQTPIGRVIVEGEICLLADERECGLCRAHCPYEAIRLKFCPETYAVLPWVDPSRCTGCGACEVICPTQPRKAIRVEPFGGLW